MSRSVQVGDLAFVRLGDQVVQSTVLVLDKSNIYIGQPGANTGSLIYYHNGDWRVYGAENIPYVVEFQAARASSPHVTSSASGFLQTMMRNLEIYIKDYLICPEILRALTMQLQRETYLLLSI